MATHDFTLEDIHKLLLSDIRTVVREEVDASFDRKFAPAFEAAFKPSFDSAFEPFADAIQGDFNQINTRLDRLESKVDLLNGFKRIVGQHSKEIIDLRSRLA